MKNEDYIFGIRPVIEAIESGKDVDKVLIKKGLEGELFDELRLALKQIRVTIQYVPIEKLNRVTRKNHQGVIAFVSPISFSPLNEVVQSIYESGKNPLILVLDRVTDVRNFGAICRTAECSGVDAVIIPGKGSSAINADAMKTSAGALNLLPVSKVFDLLKAVQYLKDSGMEVFACTEKAREYYTEKEYTKPTVIVMGSEENGISQEIIDIADHQVKIPIKGEIQSLNVSVACGVILYQALNSRLMNPEK